MTDEDVAVGMRCTMVLGYKGRKMYRGFRKHGIPAEIVEVYDTKARPTIEQQKGQRMDLTMSYHTQDFRHDLPVTPHSVQVVEFPKTGKGIHITHAAVQSRVNGDFITLSVDTRISLPLLVMVYIYYTLVTKDEIYATALTVRDERDGRLSKWMKKTARDYDLGSLDVGRYVSPSYRTYVLDVGVSKNGVDLRAFTGTHAPYHLNQREKFRADVVCHGWDRALAKRGR